MAAGCRDHIFSGVSVSVSVRSPHPQRSEPLGPRYILGWNFTTSILNMLG